MSRILVIGSMLLFGCEIPGIVSLGTPPPDDEPSETAPTKVAIGVTDGTAAPPTTSASPAPKTPFLTPLPRYSMGYGAQVNWTARDPKQSMGEVQQLGFDWVKIQLRWCDFELERGLADLNKIIALTDAAQARGLRVLFSVTCAPKWTRADNGAGGSGPPDNMQDAANFMSGVASFFCQRGLGAMEVWNEHNLLTEWHGKPISAAAYMDMLKRAYAGIKKNCPSVTVISGAPTPTGYDDGTTAIDDVKFLKELYQNGLKQNSDAIGAHPSGFCNAPDAAPLTKNQCNAFFDHPSFFFRGTLERYRETMVLNGDSGKRIWVTEFGWAVDPTPKKGYEYAKSITLEQQAQWTVKAFQMMKSYGYVGAAFLWNLDFQDMTQETGAFHILGRPVYDRLKTLAK
ncbi:MAG: hypothetical protein HY327_13565 [Chloroflexi bacterium]|nr:hypothetical protein [Chloroflexota bacterium]